MSQASVTPELRTVKLNHNSANIDEVYEVIRLCAPGLTAKEFSLDLIKEFTPEDADLPHWYKTLCNLEYTRNRPKKAKRSRSKTGCYNRKHNPAEEVVKRATFNALMEVA